MHILVVRVRMHLPSSPQAREKPPQAPQTEVVAPHIVPLAAAGP